MTNRDTPPQTPSKPTPGYPEKQPRDPGEAREDGPRKPPNPDEGGLDRTPDEDADPAGGD